MQRCLALVLIILLVASPAWSQQEQTSQLVSELPWQSYPSVGRIASVAQISLKGDLRYLDPVSTSRFLELYKNPPRSNEYTIAPRNLAWFVICNYDPTGYVRDDERLDPDELLNSLREQDAQSSEERRRLKLPALRLDGWAVPPHYDVQTRRLEWGTRLITEDGHVTINYRTRILGRSGLINMILVSDADDLDANIKTFQTALQGFEYVAGERYTEFRQGDHMAEYGLGALIVGGAAAAAASSGVMKGLGKFIGLAAFAAVAAIGGFFKRVFGKKAPKV